MSEPFPENPFYKIIKIDNFITKDKCNEVIKLAEKQNEWETKRHKNYPTTDIPAEKVEGLDLSKELERIVEITRKEYKLEDSAIIRPFDVFVVKYDVNGQNKLDIHRDVSELSFVLLLSDPDDFEGGGTYYVEDDKTVSPEQGGLALHCGFRLHSGKAITKGIRYILIGFMKVTSKIVRQYHKKEKKLNFIDEIDKRHLDFLWRHDTKPLNLQIKIINLKRRKKKLKKMMDIINRLEIPSNWKVDIKAVIANEGEGAEAYPNWKLEDPQVSDNVKRFWKQDVRKGEIGCFLSHVTTIQDCESDYLLILEDDAEFKSDFLWRIDQSIRELKYNNIDWDGIDFGGKSVDDKSVINITPSVCKIGYSYETHCILYNRSGINKIKQVDKTKNVIAYDEFLTAIRKVHPRTELNTLYDLDSEFNMYFSYKPLSWQRLDDNGNYSHDTYLDTIINWKIESVIDDFTLKNYYVFSDVEDLLDLNSLFFKANKSLWNFHIESCSEDVFFNENKWYLPVKNNRKITAVIYPEKLWLRQEEEIEIDCKLNSIYFFPSYLMFKYTGKDTRIVFGCGAPFH